MKKALAAVLAAMLLVSLATATVSADDLPEYTKTSSYSTEYAEYGGEQWGAAPKTLEAELHAREQYTVALCTDYWANVGESGYNEEERPLEATFTSGEGLLNFSVRIGAGPIWGGATCELLTITPTDAAFAITEPVTATGTFHIYWRGWCDMPFSVTVDPYPTEQPEDLGYTDIVSDSTDYAYFGGEQWGAAPKTVEAEIGAKERFTMALATDYWADPPQSGYSAKPTALTPTFTEGDGLLEFSVRIDAGPIWGGATCELLTITPTEQARALTEPVTATGTFHIFWRGWCDMPFSVTINPAANEAPETDPSLPEYTEVISDSTDYAYSGNESWGAEPGVVEATIRAREKYTLALATSFWAPTDQSGYTDQPTYLDAAFTEGDGLLSFSVRNAPGPIWGGAECELLTITPTDAAYTITEPVTAEGTIHIFWRGWCEMPFSVTINPAALSEEEANDLIREVGSENDVDGEQTGRPVPDPLFVRNSASLEEMKEGFDLREDVYAFFDIWAGGNAATSISRKIDLGKDVGPLPLMKESVIKGLPCMLDGFDCDGLDGCTWQDAKVMMNKNGKLLNITFSGQDGMVLIDLALSEQGEAEELPFTVEGEFYFERGAHLSEGIPFSFTITGKPAAQENKTVNTSAVVMGAEGAVILAEAGVIASLLSKKKKKEKQ